MNRDQQLAVFHDRIAAGTMSEEDAADMFMLTMVGQSAGVTRTEVLARIRARFQDRAVLNAFLRNSLAAFHRALAGRR